MYPFHISRGMEGDHVPPHPGWEETDTRMEWAGSRQHRGVCEVGLGAPTSPPSASEPSAPHFLSSITRLFLASWAPRHVTSPGSGAQGHGQQGGVTGCGESRAWARAGSRCSKKPDSQDFRWLGYSPSQNSFENHNKTALIGV